MAKVPPDIDEKAAVKEAGFPSVLEQVNRVNTNTPLTKTRPGEFSVSTVCANLVISNPSPQQREQFINVLVAKSPILLGTRLVKAIVKAEDAKLHDGGPGIDDICYDMGQKTLKKHYDEGNHLIRTDDRSFWRYTGTHWRRVVDEQVKNRILDVVKSENPDMPFAAAVDASLRLLSYELHVEGDPLLLLKESPSVINCLNGELWLGKDGKIDKRDHDPKNYLTNCLDVIFDPDATCPQWDKAILEIFEGDTEMVEYIEEFGGYVIQPRRNIPAWFAFVGVGNNGKTKVVETFAKLMGDESILAMEVSKVPDDKFAMGDLSSKLMLLDDDVRAGIKLPDGFLKKLSERKTLSGQHKFKDVFKFVNAALPVMLMNGWPRVTDLSWGFRRRAQIANFPHKFVAGEDEDKNLFERILADELPGVLNRCIRGFQRLQKRQEFSKPAARVRVTDEFFKRGNPLQAYLDEGCVHDASITTELGVFYKGFTSWCDDEGRMYRDTRGTIKGKLEDLGYAMGKVGHNRNGVVGVRPMTWQELQAGVVADDPKDASPKDDEIPF